MFLERYSIATILCLRVECTSCDPNDGELCPNRVKPEESLLEVCSNSEMQIDHQIWISIYVTRFAKRGLIHAQSQDTLFIAIC